MTKHVPVSHFKSDPATESEPSWVWDDDDVPPYTALEGAGYIIGTRCLFKAFAVVHGLPIYLGAYVGKRAACRAIADAHHGGDV